MFVLKHRLLHRHLLENIGLSSDSPPWPATAYVALAALFYSSLVFADGGQFSLERVWRLEKINPFLVFWRPDRPDIP